VRQGKTFRVETTEQRAGKRRRWRRQVDADVIQQQLSRLREANLPAFPVSPMVCDGAYVQLTISGEHADLRLGWWTIAPKGAEVLADFADWLWKLGMPDSDEDQADGNENKA
jgi:hypothetical protein